MLSYMLHGYLAFIIFMSGAAEPVRMIAHVYMTFKTHTAMIQSLLCGISLARLLALKKKKNRLGQEFIGNLLPHVLKTHVKRCAFCVSERKREKKGRERVPKECFLARRTREARLSLEEFKWRV